MVSALYGGPELWYQNFRTEPRTIVLTVLIVPAGRVLAEVLSN